MNKIQKELYKYRDEKYASFQATIVPSTKKTSIIGVRVPDIRKIAKTITFEDGEKFLNDLPHKYYEENILHSVLLANYKDYGKAIDYVEKFLPYIDNWAVCDTLSVKCFKKHKDELLIKIKKWIKSKEVYTCRFGVDCLMSLYLDEDFKPEYLKLVSTIKSNEYYINMMIAWYYATALAKKWDETIVYLEDNKLGTWVHNKTIQKAIESYRISDSQKKYLKTLRKLKGE